MTGLAYEEVIILDSSPSSSSPCVQDKKTTAITITNAFIELSSDSEATGVLAGALEPIRLSEPLHDRINRILSRSKQNEIKEKQDKEVKEKEEEETLAGRDSFFESFYEKWVLKKEETPIKQRAMVLSPKVEILPEPRPKPKRTKTVASRAAVETELLPLPDLPTHVPPPATGRAPRTKEEACHELTLLLDDRLNARLQLAPQMTTPFKIRIERLEMAGMVVWKRRRPTLDGQIEQATTNEQVAPVCCLLVDCETFGPEIESNPEAFIQSLKASFQTQRRFNQIYFLLVGFKSYGQKVANRVNKSFREAVLTGERVTTSQRNAMAHLQASWQEIEHRLFLACTSICSLDGIQSPFRLVFQETILLARQFIFDVTRDVAWLPYSANDSKFNFCTINTVKSGSSLDETWRLMLTQILRVTPQIASAIAQVYPSLGHLTRAYQQARSPTEASLLLQGLQVNGRSVGQALSTRIHRVMTGRNPDLIIK